MSKFEPWKIRRELYRIFYQIVDVVRTPAVDNLLINFRNWREKPQPNIVTAGDLPYGGKVAVFLLFQPRGLADSAWFTLDHLVKQGWSPLIVSNAPISEADLKRLRGKSVKIIQRDNFGYDFGGYLDGVRMINADGIAPEYVLILNDSSWFPLRENDDTLARLEAMNADLCGHVFKTEDAKAKWRDHIESHLLMFSRNGWESPAIRAFWDNYVMTSDKAATINRGERGLSQTALKAGLKVETIWDRSKAVAWLMGLSDDDLAWALSNLSLHADKYQDKIDAILAKLKAGDSEGARKDTEAWTWETLSNSLQILASASFLLPASKAGMINFVKKTSDVRYHYARHDFLAALDAGVIDPVHPAVEAEIREKFASWTPEITWRSRPDGKIDMPRRYRHLS